MEITLRQNRIVKPFRISSGKLMLYFKLETLYGITDNLDKEDIWNIWERGNNYFGILNEN